MIGKHIAVVGATGAVGQEALRILEERQVPARQIRALASERSAGSRLAYASETLAVHALTPEAFEGVGVALFCASSDASLRHAPHAIAAGAFVVDNSSAFRLDPRVPLIIPEINGHALARSPSPPLVANPNCSTILLLMTIHPLCQRFAVRGVDVATYQAVSGAGAAGISELLSQAAAHARNDATPPQPEVFPEPCAFNVFSHDSSVALDTGVNGEERKMIDESRKILASPRLRITPTCVRVPVVRAHTQAITLTLEESITEEHVRDAFASAPGVRIIDDRASNHFPTPLKASGQDEVLVGRIRPDPGVAGDATSNRWCFLASMDQLRKGAATNAIQIAEMLAPDLLRPNTR